jgi:hypothetical protein
MSSTPLIWHPGARKEATDLIEHLWRTGDDAVRDRLAEVLLAGPPEDLDNDQIDPDERQARRDRRLFDRLGLLIRDKSAPLSPRLQSAQDEILQRHPGWQLREGEQARFVVWSEVGNGPDTAYSLDDLRAMEDPELVELLSGETNRREGLLESWRQLVGLEPERAIRLFRTLQRQTAGGPPDVWQTGLWGLREASESQHLQDRLVELLNTVPNALFGEISFSRAVADFLEACSTRFQGRPTEDYWRLFDRALAAAETDRDNAESPKDSKWIERAINRSLGHLATAMLNGLFAYRLRGGDGVPPDQCERLNRLLGVGQPQHRLARVIAASRLPYLFAVDPDWTRATLLPCMSWDDEEEATALWQGFAWAPRVGPELWAEIRSPFLDAFTPERLRRFGDLGRNMAQLLMLAGIVFSSADIPVDRAGAAVKAMTGSMRENAIWWTCHYLEGGGDPEDEPRADRADVLWRDRVKPWLGRVWPHELDYRSPGLSDRFATLAAATNEEFPDAVGFLSPFLVKSDALLALHRLNETSHPDRHPVETLQLLNAVLDLNAFWIPDNVRGILDRIAKAQPDLKEDPIFRRFTDRLLRQPN